MPNAAPIAGFMIAASAMDAEAPKKHFGGGERGYGGGGDMGSMDF